MGSNGSHRARPHHAGDGDRAADQPSSARSAGALDPEDRDLVEPDRGARQQVPAAEQDSRTSVFTDRDPEDDIRLAAADPRDVEQGG